MYYTLLVFCMGIFLTSITYAQDGEYIDFDKLKEISIEIPVSPETPDKKISVTLDSIVHRVHIERLAKIQNDLLNVRDENKSLIELKLKVAFSLIVACSIDRFLFHNRLKSWKKTRFILSMGTFFITYTFGDWLFDTGNETVGASKYFIDETRDMQRNEADLYAFLFDSFGDAQQGVLNKVDFIEGLAKFAKDPFLNRLLWMIIADSGIYSGDENLIDQDLNYDAQKRANTLLETYFIDKHFGQNIGVSSLANTYPGFRYLPYSSMMGAAILKKMDLSFLVPHNLQAIKGLPMLGQFGKETIALMALMYFPELMEEEDSFSLVPILSSVALSYATSRVALAGVTRLIKAYKVFRAGSKAAAVGEAATGPLGWKVFILNQLAVITASMLLEGPITQWYTKRKIWLALQDTRSIFYTFLHDPLLDPWVVNATVSTFYQLLNEYRRLVLGETFDKDNQFLEEGRVETIRIDVMQENEERIHAFLTNDLWKSKPLFELREEGVAFDTFVTTHSLGTVLGKKIPVPIKTKHVCHFLNANIKDLARWGAYEPSPIIFKPFCEGDGTFDDLARNGASPQSPQEEYNELFQKKEDQDPKLEEKRQYTNDWMKQSSEKLNNKVEKARAQLRNIYYGLDVARRDFIREQCKDLQKIDPKKINIKDSSYPPSMVYSAPLVNSSYQDTLIAGFAFAKYLEKTFSEFDTKGNSWHWLVERETKHIESLNKLCEKIPKM